MGLHDAPTATTFAGMDFVTLLLPPPRYTKKQPQPRLFCFWITMLVYSENHFFKVFKNSATGISAQPLLS